MANWFKPPPPRPGTLADVLSNRGTSALPGSLARNLFKIDPRIVANLLKAFLRQIEKPTSPAVQAGEGFEGFSKCGECPTPLPPLWGAWTARASYTPPSHVWCGYSDSCLSGQTVQGYPTRPWPALDVEYNGMIILKQNAYTYIGQQPPVGSLRAQDVVAYVRSPGPKTLPVRYRPGLLTPFDPETLPFPEWVRQLPVTKPYRLPESPTGPRAIPLPQRTTVPDVFPDWYEVGPARGPSTRPKPGTSPGPQEDPQPTRGPVIQPDPNLDPDPGADPGTGPATGELPTPKGGLIPLESLTLANAQLEVDYMKRTGDIRPSKHTNNPPGRGVKEKKATIVFGPGGAGKVYGLVTETKDVIECFWRNLPKEVRAKRKGQHRTAPNMLDDIYANWKDLDVPKTVKCLVLNEIVDRGIGKASQAGLRDWRKNLPEKGYRPLRGPSYGMGPNRRVS